MNDSAVYDHSKIEANWKNKWFADNLYEAVDFSPKPKKFILAELPYPSGKYLHVGHMMRYTVPEIYSRYLRMKGFNVLFPMGWDSFGLPAETFALKSNSTPRKVLDQAIPEYKKSMMDMGYAIDWTREIDTSQPDFYKWTQWMFLKMWEAGLAEIKEMPVWWCQALGVLADEEVLTKPDGTRVSERDNHPVERKIFKQWVLKITKYADKMLDGLDKTQYTPSVKQAQVNWIGKKEGINITYKIVDDSGKDTKKTVTCFTTRPDTNFGATFVVIAPEHPLVEQITPKGQLGKVQKYVKDALNKSELQRTSENNGSGIFTGTYALNTLTKTKMPIFVADYVLAQYGTGAVVGVPGHDKRDFEFAKHYGLPILRVVVGTDGDTTEITKVEQVQEESGKMINSGFLDEMDINKATDIMINYMEEKGYGEKHTTYKLRDQIWSRQRYWGEPIPLVYTKDNEIEPDYNLPLKLPELTPEVMSGRKDFPTLDQFQEFISTSDSKGREAKRETDTMPTWAGSNWYYIRYIDPKNTEEFANYDKLKYWLPVDKYYGDAGHTTAHLLYTRFWYKFLYDLGLVPHTEPIMYRMSGGLLLGEDNRKMSKSRPEFVVNPEDAVQNYGADAVRTYLAFIGPYDETYPWCTDGLKAIARFIKNAFSLKFKVKNNIKDTEVEKAYNKMVKTVTEMCEGFKMNTAVSQLMIFVNLLKKKDEIDIDIWKGFIRVLAPFAPFVAEELWQEINGFETWKKENSVHLASWPDYDKTKIADDTFQVPVQINGKVRAVIEVTKDISEDEVKAIAYKNENVKKFLNSQIPGKVIYIKEKILNIVL